MEYLGWILLGVVAGVASTVVAILIAYRFIPQNPEVVSHLLREHFQPIPLNKLTISQRQFPFRVRADLQHALDRLFVEPTRLLHFCGIRSEFGHNGLSLSDCIIDNQHSRTLPVPPDYEEIDIGEEQPIQVLLNGLWLLEKDGVRFVVLLSPVSDHEGTLVMQFQIASPNTEEGKKLPQDFFRQVEDFIQKSETYRGKILSLEQASQSYTGKATGITVHKLRLVERDQVVLPKATIDLLDRNVIQFVKQWKKLTQFRQATKKGLLFYGPPGTGKTHTIHYLARALEGHTTLLISAEQVSLLSEYMTLARLLQPSIVVIEDVDLIARDRRQMNSPCEEVLLNKLLKEMDGLKEEADILFLLTTNRPEALEAALAARPGRIDQAIEFPLPDEQGRAKLVRLYSQGVSVSEDGISEITKRTEGVSASFIKELMRRIVQFHIDADGTGNVTQTDIDNALDEMLFKGGMLNLKLLGAKTE
jgi:cell division protease FtsH